MRLSSAIVLTKGEPKDTMTSKEIHQNQSAVYLGKFV